MTEILSNNWVLLQLGAFAVSVALLSLSLAIAIKRTVRNKSVRKQASLEAEVRSPLMHALYDDQPDLSFLNEYEHRRIEPIVWQLITKVRGVSRSVLVEWLETNGFIDLAIARTKSKSGVRRAVAAEHLGLAGTERAIPELIHLLNDRESEVRIVAVRALGKMGDASVTAPVLRTLTSERAVPAGIVSMALVHTGPPVVEGLITGLTSEHAIVRLVCAELLGIYGAYEAGNWMIAALQSDSSIDVRVGAACALGRLGLPKGEDVLQRSTAVDEPVSVRVAATVALGRLGSARSLGVLQILLNDPVADVSGAAAQALVQLSNEGLEVLNLEATSEGSGRIHAQHWLARTEITNSARRRRRSVPLVGESS